MRINKHKVFISLELPNNMNADDLIRLRTGITNLSDYKINKRPAATQISKLKAVREKVRAAQRSNQPTAEQTI